MTIRLTHRDVTLLAQMPMTSGSRPAESLTDPQLARSWRKLETKGLIDGGPGAYFVRWGLLSVGQCKRLSAYRKATHPTPVTDSLTVDQALVIALEALPTQDLYLLFKVLLVTVGLNVKPLTDPIAEILERRVK